MRRRRSHTGGSTPHNLDSFLDTLTNTVGVMIFVLLFVTLSAADASVLVRTPLRTEVSKEELFFEVSGDRVALLDTERANEQVRRRVAALPRPDWWNLSTIVQRIYDFSGSTGNHDVDLVGSVLAGEMGVRYRLKPGAGDPIKSLKSPESDFQRALAAADTSRNVVAFIVRADGFAAFREARKIATARGFRSGWEPVQEEVVFGSGGRTVGVQ
ncbi:MAG TPA: hypothetical protein VFS20_23115 [Longimicrobium sp.]|nr:hypothetical protein [Longimicrobium sp.]